MEWITITGAAISEDACDVCKRTHSRDRLAIYSCSDGFSRCGTCLYRENVRRNAVKGAS